MDVDIDLYFDADNASEDASPVAVGLSVGAEDGLNMIPALVDVDNDNNVLQIMMPDQFIATTDADGEAVVLIPIHVPVLTTSSIATNVIPMDNEMEGDSNASTSSPNETPENQNISVPIFLDNHMSDFMQGCTIVPYMELVYDAPVPDRTDDEIILDDEEEEVLMPSSSPNATAPPPPPDSPKGV